MAQQQEIASKLAVFFNACEKNRYFSFNDIAKATGLNHLTIKNRLTELSIYQDITLEFAKSKSITILKVIDNQTNKKLDDMNGKLTKLMEITNNLLEEKHQRITSKKKRKKK